MAPPLDPVASTPAALVADALRLERAGELTRALEAYEAALALAPGDPDLLAALAALAQRMDMPGQALALWAQAGAADPGRLEAVDGAARALAALHRYEEAIEALRRAILDHPHEARLWNALGVVLAQQGDGARAVAFFDEAVRLEPGFAAALYNRGDAHFDLGALAHAEADFDAAARHAASPEQTATIAFARALLALHRGELAAGWDAYEARLSPDIATAPTFEAPGAPWTPDTPLDSAHLLALGEQGLGDEVMFMGLVADVQAALGPQGRLSLAVEPRLTALVQRSFPDIEVLAHATERRAGRPCRSAPGAGGTRPVDLHVPLGSLPRRFRREAGAFAGAAYLRPDPERVRAWRDWLGDGAPCVGLSWRSGLLKGRRRRQYPALADWGALLAVEGVRFVDLQYGATADELAALGERVRTPAGLDLRDDLDGLAALASALDLVISVPNATAALAAACGAQTWFLSGPAAWTRLGTDGYPWYARTRSFCAASYGDWGGAMQAVSAALTAFAATAPARPHQGTVRPR